MGYGGRQSINKMSTSYKLTLATGAIVFIMFVILNINTRLEKRKLINLGKLNTCSINHLNGIFFWGHMG